MKNKLTSVTPKKHIAQAYNGHLQAVVEGALVDLKLGKKAPGCKRRKSYEHAVFQGFIDFKTLTLENWELVTGTTNVPGRQGSKGSKALNKN